MSRDVKLRAPVLRFTVAAALGAIGATSAVHAAELKIDGYIREALSWNTKDWVDTPNYDDKGKLSMARTTLRVNADWDLGNGVAVVAKARASREVKTGFLKHLEEIGARNFQTGGRGDIMDLYNEADLRELYVDFPIGDRLKVRLGKQQVVWGETDFFAANDLVHGFNFTWRSFLEPANEELRKPNIMANVRVDVPELNGGLQVVVRPGWDRKRDIGTELDVYGGRWSSQPYAGVDFRNIDPYDFSNPEGDYKKVTGGIRWSGIAFDGINYSASYLKTFWPSPIMNASSTLKLFGLPGVPSGAQTVGRTDTIGLAGDIIYPIVDLVGFTASGYSPLADAVFSTEVAYIKDAPYQILSNPPTLISQAVAPGFDGIKRKNVLAWMLRMDKNIAATQSLLGSEKPMFFSVQLFDKWIQSYDANDGLLNSVGWGAKTKQHSFLLTGIFSLSYNNGKVKPELVLGRDLSYGGGFAVPSVTFELGTNWRWKLEYDRFWSPHWRDGANCGFPNAASCDTAGLFGYFHNRDQIYTSLTYQF